MYAHISRHARVYLTERQQAFISHWRQRDSFLQSELPVEDAITAKTLSDKGILVRKKLDADTQYALNKHIRFEKK